MKKSIVLIAGICSIASMLFGCTATKSEVVVASPPSQSSESPAASPSESPASSPSESPKLEPSPEPLKDEFNQNRIYTIKNRGSFRSACGGIDGTGNLIYPHEYYDLRYLPMSNTVMLEKVFDRDDPSETQRNYNFYKAIGTVDGKLLTDFKYEYILDISKDLVALQRYLSVDFVNPSNGKLLFSLEDVSSAMLGGNYWVCTSNGSETKLYSIDALNNGSTEPAAIFSDWPQFLDDSYVAFKRDGVFGVLDPSGKEIIPPKFDEIESYGDGLFSFKIDQLWGYCDLKGDVVIEPQFIGVVPFSKGKAYVKMNKFDPFFTAENMTALIDKSGKVVKELQGIRLYSSVPCQDTFLILAGLKDKLPPPQTPDPDTGIVPSIDESILPMEFQTRDVILDMDGNISDLTKDLDFKDLYYQKTLRNGEEVVQFNKNEEYRCGIYNPYKNTWSVPYQDYSSASIIYANTYNWSMVEEVTTTFDTDDFCFIAMDRIDSPITDIYDNSGKKVGSISGYTDYTDGKLARVTRGFYQGYVDMNDNWVYKEPIFSSLMTD